jgi:nitrite reductase/ring-hydroxylating ferredoxin subunit
MVMDTPEAEWTSVVALDALPDGRAARVEAFGVSVLLFRTGTAIYAVASRCTHQGAPLERGVVKANGAGPSVTCPAHGSVFSLVDGAVRRGPATQPVRAFETRLNDGAVELRPKADSG